MKRGGDDSPYRSFPFSSLSLSEILAPKRQALYSDFEGEADWMGSELGKGSLVEKTRKAREVT